MDKERQESYAMLVVCERLEDLVIQARKEAAAKYASSAKEKDREICEAWYIWEKEVFDARCKAREVWARHYR